MVLSDLIGRRRETRRGIDISKQGGAWDAELARRGIRNVLLSVQNPGAIDFADRIFVFGPGILHHLDYDKAMSELHRVLKPGGAVLFTEPLGHKPAVERYRRHTPEVFRSTPVALCCLRARKLA